MTVSAQLAISESGTPVATLAFQMGVQAASRAEDSLRFAQQGANANRVDLAAWADNAIGLAVGMTVAAINRINVQGTPEQQAEQIRSVMATVFPEAVALVREARQGLA